MSEPLEAARAAVQRSDQARRPSRDTLPMATLRETVALRDAMRALLQWAEDAEQRLTALDETRQPDGEGA